jgi:RNA polymerase sigma-70 factor (ECF subfamily)
MRISISKLANETNRQNVNREYLENRLLAQVAQKDREALAQLYTRFERPLFSYLFHLVRQKELAEDILQEVMVIIWQKAHTFQGASQATSWIFGIAHHQAFKALRQPGNILLVELESASEIQDDAPIPEVDLLRQTTRDEITKAMALLSPEHREVLELAFFQDFACKEIADIVGIPVGTVKSRLSYARQALKAALIHQGWKEE